MGIYYNLKFKRIFGTRKERYYCGVKRQNKTKQNKNANFRALGAASLLSRRSGCVPCSTV